MQQATCNSLHHNCNKTCTEMSGVRDACHQGHVQSASGLNHSVDWYHRLDSTLWLAASFRILC